MTEDYKHTPNDFYEAYFPGLGVVKWQGNLPEQVETDQGLVSRDILKQLFGTRLWERKAGKWILSDKHA